MIPIYRAKKIDSDEYVIGYCEYIPNDGRSINTINSGCWISLVKLDNEGFRNRFEFEVDKSTLAIHFPDMLDSQGNKIFASLSEDGKGGDVLESKWFNIDSDLSVKTESVRWSKSGFCFIQDGYNIARYEYIKIIGIQE